MPSTSRSLFSRLHYGFAGILAFKQESTRITQAVLHSKLDIQNIFIFRQHRRLFETGSLEHHVPPHIHRANLAHKHQFVLFNGIGKAPIEARIHGRFVFAELRNDRLLPLLHNEEAGAQPNQHQHAHDQAGADTRTFHVGLKVSAAIARWWFFRATKQTAQLPVEIAPEFIQIRRTGLRGIFRPASLRPAALGRIV